MLRGKAALGGIILLLLATMAAAVPPRKARDQAGVGAIATSLDCARHRFETTIQLTGPDGKLQGRTVRMCGTAGESDAAWITTLKDAVKKTAGSQMAAAAKEQIIAAVDAEIARLSGTGPAATGLGLPQGADISKLPGRASRSEAERPLARDYSALPPLPTATTVAPPHILGPGGANVEIAHLTIRCALAGDEERADACDTIDKSTVLVVRADEAYPKGLAVRFVRGGDAHGEVSLPPMIAGETRKFRMPASVCRGVVRSTVEIDAQSANAPSGAMAGKVGDYDLRC